MYAFLNQNDISNLKLAIDKMKGVDFDAARKMELLVEAYETQEEKDAEIEQYQEAIEQLPGWNDAGHLDHVKATADMLNRAVESGQEWGSYDDNAPLDENVKALVKQVEKHAGEVAELKDRLSDVFNDVLAAADRGTSADLITIRNLSVTALKHLSD